MVPSLGLLIFRTFLKGLSEAEVVKKLHGAIAATKVFKIGAT